MKCNQRMAKLGAALLAFVTITLLLASGASAQGTYKTLYKFPGDRARYVPTGGLIFDQAGNLYGTTRQGGAHGGGVVFKLAPNADGTWTESVLYDFCSLTGCTDGADSAAGLILDQSGNLYGTTYGGGNSACTGGCGVVFELSPSGGIWTESVLYSFSGADGGNPLAGLVFDQTGNLCGTTVSGGTRNGGTVFKLTPKSGGGWTESVLHSFTGGGDGYSPFGGVVFDHAGNLYGTTYEGGHGSVGTVFTLQPGSGGTWTEKVLHHFRAGTDGSYPHDGLILDSAGNLYGTTAAGGRYDGVVFKLTPNSGGAWTETVIHRFDVANGEGPYAGLTFDDQGNLYGTTIEGGYTTLCGNAGCGVVFKLVPNGNGGWDEKMVHKFSDHPGAGPMSGIIFDLAGNLYGTTVGDNVTTVGTVFEITP